MDKGIACALLYVLAASGCDRAEPGQISARVEHATPGSIAPTTAASSPPTAAAFSVAGLASCEATAPVTSAIEKMARAADSNGDGEVSKSEAMMLSNFALGGAFFRADENGDGTVTPEEGRAVRTELLLRYPELEALVLAARAAGKHAFVLPASLGDIEYGKPLAISDVRRAAKALVDDLFAIADKNQSGSIALDEVRATSIEGAKALGRIAFEKTDKDGDGALSQDELMALVDAPLRRAFDSADVDDNGRLSADEAIAALSLLARTVGVPSTEASNASKASTAHGG